MLEVALLYIAMSQLIVATMLHVTQSLARRLLLCLLARVVLYS